MAIDANSQFYILYDDATPSGTLTTQNENASYPSDNLEDRDRQTYWKAGSVGANYIRLYHGATAVQTYGCGILNHNFYDANVTSVQYQWSNNGTSWTTLETITKAQFGADNMDYYVYAPVSSKYVQLLINGPTGLSTLGRFYVAQGGIPTSAQTAPWDKAPIYGSNIGHTNRVDILETLTGIEHRIERGEPKRRHTWAWERIDSEIYDALADLFEASHGRLYAFVISDPEDTTDQDEGRCFHVRFVAEDFMRQLQIASRQNVVLDMIEVK